MNIRLSLSWEAISDTNLHEKHFTLETANAEERENFANEHPVNIDSEQSEKRVN